MVKWNGGEPNEIGLLEVLMALLGIGLAVAVLRIMGGGP